MTLPALDLQGGLATVRETSPLIPALTNDVTIEDVAQVIRHWGGLPVMTNDEREVDELVAASNALLVNIGTVDERSERAMLRAGGAATDGDVPVVLDPVGVGATATRDRVAARLLTDIDVSLLNGNYGEITALVGEEATVRGVESVGSYDEIAKTAVAAAQQFETVVVASGETDIVATSDGAYEVQAGHPMMGAVVGTGCLLGGTLATMLSVMQPERAALLGTVAFGLAGEVAADGQFGEVQGPASYQIAFRDAIAGLRDADTPAPEERVERVIRAAE